MPIPARRIPVQLVEATPTPVTVEAVKSQLDDIGLNCALAAEDRLEVYIKEVEQRIPQGSTQTYQILRPATGAGALVAGVYGDYEQSSIGNWEPSGTGLGYSRELEYIQEPTHFDWLLGNQPGFTGIVNNPPEYKGRYGSVDAIKEMFINVSVNASATLVKGLNRGSMESVLSNAIAPLTDKNAQNYAPGPQSRVIFLVEDYDPSTGAAAAVGVLSLWWDLKIVDYKEKKKSPQHDTTLTVRTRSVLYDSVEAMTATTWRRGRTSRRTRSRRSRPDRPRWRSSRPVRRRPRTPS